MKQLISVLILLVISSAALAQGKKRIDFGKDVDQLGGNRALLEMAHAIDPENRTRIVQKRAVDRYNRFELGLNYGGHFGGDAYVRTQSVGLNMDFHLSPRWSLGARYVDHGNDLSPEGRRAFSEAQQAYETGGRTFVVPDIDYARRSAFATVSWYPVYGKTNLLDRGIAQFDFYLLAGAGQVELSSGWTSLGTAGVGMGVWLNHNLTARGEVRYQNYKDQIITGSRQIHAAVATVGLGWML